MMGASNNYSCRECGVTKPGNFFISPTLCKRCAAKRRGKPSNPLIEVTEGILATKLVLKRLRAKAEKQIPLKTRDWLAEFVWLPVYGTFLWLWLPLGLALFNWKRVGDFVLFILWVIGAAAIPLILTLLLTSKLKAPRNAKIANCTIQLALERQEEIVETERFYASAEWKNARQVVIRDQGSVCKKCGKSIRNQLNVTVDHIKPRKKFPSLALELSNLQVLCRSCNSAKGARFIEIDN